MFLDEFFTAQRITYVDSWGGKCLSQFRNDVPSSYGAAGISAANAEGTVGATRPCLLVMLGSTEYDLDLIHASRRLAAALVMDWAVVCFQPSSFRFLPDRERDRRLEVMRIAESLGGEAVILQGNSPAKAIASYARRRVCPTRTCPRWA